MKLEEKIEAKRIKTMDTLKVIDIKETGPPCKSEDETVQSTYMFDSVSTSSYVHSWLKTEIIKEEPTVLMEETIKHYSFERQYSKVKKEKPEMLEDAHTLSNITDQFEDELLRSDICKERTLDRHASLHIDQKTYKCDICKTCLGSRTTLCNHLKLHTGEYIYKCDICNKMFSCRKYIFRHIEWHSNPFKYMCKVCGKVLINAYSLDRHCKSHSLYDSNEHVRNVFKCVICAREFISKSVLKHHMNVHNRNFKCGTCGKRFSSKYNLVMHIKSHNVTYVCSICGKATKWERSYKRHLSLHSSDRYDCSICDKPFSLKETLTKHMLLVHVGEKKFVCDFCGKMYALKWCLAEHMRKHSLLHFHSKVQMKKYSEDKTKVIAGGNRTSDNCELSCNLCGKIFLRELSLYKHIQVHEKKYKCEICHKVFRLNGSLTQHKELHSGKKKYCDICKIAFSTKPYLRRHMTVHNPVKIFECFTCGNNFKYKKSIILHVRTHLQNRGRESIDVKNAI